ncbi:MAG: hypothetical protein MJ237_05715 [bacterium]|nr:hypothetical protein [bacterium]
MNNLKILRIVAIILFVIYIAIPPYNKIAQIGYCYNNFSMLYSQLIDSQVQEEYMFHRNNAVYLARMNSKRSALREIDRAIALAPSIIQEQKMQELYADRAEIRLYFKEYKGALDDYLKLNNLNMTENLKVAMILKQLDKKKMALSYCNNILSIDINAYAGYSCIADLYASVGKYNVSVAVFDLLIDRVPNRAKYYTERAMYKKLCRDLEGYEADLKIAHDLSPVQSDVVPIAEAVLEPKNVDLKIE